MLKFSHYKTKFVTVSFYHYDAWRPKQEQLKTQYWIDLFLERMLFPRLVDNVLAILRLKNGLIDRGQWLFNSFAMSQSRPRRYDQVFIFRTFISSFFFNPKQTSKKVFHCRTQNAKFTGNSKLVDREIMISNSLEVQSLECCEDRLLLSHSGTEINIH